MYKIKKTPCVQKWENPQESAQKTEFYSYSSFYADSLSDKQDWTNHNFSYSVRVLCGLHVCCGAVIWNSRYCNSEIQIKEIGNGHYDHYEKYQAARWVWRARGYETWTWSCKTCFAPFAPLHPGLVPSWSYVAHTLCFMSCPCLASLHPCLTPMSCTLAPMSYTLVLHPCTHVLHSCLAPLPYSLVSMSCALVPMSFGTSMLSLWRSDHKWLIYPKSWLFALFWGMKGMKSTKMCKTRFSSSHHFSLQKI